MLVCISFFLKIRQSLLSVYDYNFPEQTQIRVNRCNKFSFTTWDGKHIKLHSKRITSAPRETTWRSKQTGKTSTPPVPPLVVVDFKTGICFPNRKDVPFWTYMSQNSANQILQNTFLLRAALGQGFISHRTMFSSTKKVDDFGWMQRSKALRDIESQYHEIINNKKDHLKL